MTPPFDIQPVLTGKKVVLRPLVEGDYDALFAVASDPDIWAMHPFRVNRAQVDMTKYWDEDSVLT